MSQTSQLLESYPLTLLPGWPVVDALAAGLMRLSGPSGTVSIDHKSLRQLFAIEVTVTRWHLVRPRDWRWAQAEKMTTVAINACVAGGESWWSDHTCQEIYSASSNPDSGAVRPASYWGRLNKPTSLESLKKLLLKWWRCNYPNSRLNKRWWPALTAVLAAVNRDLGWSVVISSLQLPNTVMAIHDHLAIPGLTTEKGQAADIQPSAVQHIWRQVASYQRIQSEAPQLLFAFHHAAYGGGPGPWAKSAQDLKNRLMDNDISPYGWRLLLRHGNRLLLPWFRLFPNTHHTHESFVLIINALRLQQMMKDGRLVPMWFVTALIRAHLAECGAQPVTRGWLRVSPRVLRLAASTAMGRSAQGSRDAMRDDLHRIVQWCCRSGSSALDTLALDSDGWCNFSGGIKALIDQNAVEQQSCLSKYDFVQLQSNADFANEGALLNNCLGQKEFHDAGLRRYERHYSLRLKGTFIRVGAATFEREKHQNRWHLRMLEGPGRSIVSTTLRDAVSAFTKESATWGTK